MEFTVVIPDKFRNTLASEMAGFKCSSNAIKCYSFLLLYLSFPLFCVGFIRRQALSPQSGKGRHWQLQAYVVFITHHSGEKTLFVTAPAKVSGKHWPSLGHTPSLNQSLQPGLEYCNEPRMSPQCTLWVESATLKSHR